MHNMSYFANAMPIIALIIYYFLRHASSKSVDEYLRDRNGILALESAMETGANVKLNEQEQKVNDLLVFLKHKEIKTALETGIYPPSLHFFRAKDYIEKSDIFKLLKLMPKGAALHVHDLSMVDIHWVIKQFTYDPNLYMCFTNKQQQMFRFSQLQPKSTDCDWHPVTYYRNNFGDAQIFDEILYQNLTIVVPNPEVAYPTINAVWSKFSSVFDILFGFITHKDAFKKYYLQGLQEFYDDNVQYLEFRGTLPQLYDSDGTTYSQLHTAEVYQNATKEFKQSHEDFVGAKLIFTGVRAQNTSFTATDIKTAATLMKNFPSFFLGYDLVGPEEPGHTLLYYIKQLLEPADLGFPLKYFFHAGETAWSGTSIDKNLVDAVLLNTTRIGHGYAILKHPEVKQMARQKGIALEICPLSNQVLKLVSDLRNHPASDLLSEGYPLIISSDDPGMWGAKGLSYDWYAGFMGLGGDWADLRMLKQLAINSFKYSALSDQEKDQALSLWTSKWQDFITQVIKMYNL